MRIDTPPITIDRTAEMRRKMEELGLIDQRPIDRALEVFRTVDPKMTAIKARAAEVASLKFSVLITGETGTGKEMLAHILHGNRDTYGPVRPKFCAVNCAALPGPLFESELFGHVKGAFTGAVNDKQGLVKFASHGTLFLDELGELPLDQQAKLLRFIQSGEYRPVGSNETLTAANVRIVAATNRDLREMMAAGTFRKDLYYRIAQITFHLPPLRERQADLLTIARTLCHENDLTYVPSDANEIPLEAYSDGNVRQLLNWLINKDLES